MSKAQELTQGGGGRDPRRRPRLCQHGRHPEPFLYAEHPAAGTHQVEGWVRIGLQEPVELVEIPLQYRGYVGADSDGAGALVLPHLGQDLTGQENFHIRQFPPQQGADGFLVGRIEKRE